MDEARMDGGERMTPTRQFEQFVGSEGVVWSSASPRGAQGLPHLVC